eukprot:464410_1
MGCTRSNESATGAIDRKQKVEIWPLSYKSTAELSGNFLIGDEVIPANTIENNTEEIIKKWENAAKKAIILVLNINDANYYHTWQHNVAKLIPDEADRPVIKLVIKSSQNTQLRPLFTFGFLGGMGQLADAAVLMRTIKYINDSNELSNDMKNRIEIKLLSDASYKNIMHNLKTKEFYPENVADFLSDPFIQTFEITCNTAHDNMHFYDVFSIVDDANPFGKGRRMFIDIIATTCALINQIKYSYLKDKNAKILIVGTNQAYDAKLYQEAFDNMGFEWVNLDFEHTLIVNEEVIDKDKAYVLIGNAIKKIKKGHYGDGKRDLLQLIYDIGVKDKKENKDSSINIVAFSCSEVSLSISGSDVIGILDSLYSDAFIVDTTELMAINAFSALVKEVNKWKTTIKFMKQSGCVPVGFQGNDENETKTDDI